MILRYPELAELIDLEPGDPVAVLQARRADQLAALAARDPGEVPTATLLRLRASQQAEVELCEQALLELGAPFEAPSVGVGAVRP